MRLFHPCPGLAVLAAIMLLMLPSRTALAQGSSAPAAKPAPAPFPPPRPFDLFIPGGTATRGLPRPTVAPPSAQPTEAETPTADPAPRSVANAPVPPRRPAIAPVSRPEDEEEEPDGAWPRRTPGQRSLDFEPRVTPKDDVIANGISTDPGTSISCLPAQLKLVLDRLVKRYGSVRVTSTYRPAWRARRNSFHRRCQAMDFRIPGQAPRTVLEYVKTLDETGGHKVYWNGLVHVDTGPWRTW
ncbi:MAG: D-Ala-D-Ala carboxypeptidase family metallohydrolase [Beijerinckiaceae bacterium]|jgi:hypothetical protein|nr:D-Ala-D-Ala carboxypeptidase family metallohydrolase [Beijerinckiaceae bacterium]